MHRSRMRIKELLVKVYCDLNAKKKITNGYSSEVNRFFKSKEH